MTESELQSFGFTDDQIRREYRRLFGVNPPKLRGGNQDTAARRTILNAVWDGWDPGETKAAIEG